jgi:hypothetical protein
LPSDDLIDMTFLVVRSEGQLLRLADIPMPTILNRRLCEWAFRRYRLISTHWGEATDDVGALPEKEFPTRLFAWGDQCPLFVV